MDPGSPTKIPPPPTIHESLRSCKGVTVEELKSNPLLCTALRRLRASTTTAALDGRATTAPPLIVSSATFGDIRSTLKAKHVIKDEALRLSLKALKDRTTAIKTERDAHRFSAVGEIPRPPPPVCGPPRGYHPAAGKQTVATIGPGWLGPHRMMESFRRPTGPGKR